LLQGLRLWLQGLEVLMRLWLQGPEVLLDVLLQVLLQQ